MTASAIFPAYRPGGNKFIVLKIEIRVFLPFEIADAKCPVGSTAFNAYLFFSGPLLDLFFLRLSKYISKGNNI
jgi:hypothetical protein